MKKIFPYLTYAGAIPFLFSALYLSLDIQSLPLLGSIERILSIYGLVIASFLAGAHWGQHLQIPNNQWIYILPLFSNAIAIMLWLGFLMLSFKMQMALFVASFTALLIIDYRLYKIDIITRHYFHTRFIVTSIVIASLIISGIVS